jgi:hypothetical protein
VTSPNDAVLLVAYDESDELITPSAVLASALVPYWYVRVLVSVLCLSVCIKIRFFFFSSYFPLLRISSCAYYFRLAFLFPIVLNCLNLFLTFVFRLRDERFSGGLRTALYFEPTLTSSKFKSEHGQGDQSNVAIHAKASIEHPMKDRPRSYA